MMKLTTEEKASRFDSLTFAIGEKKKYYERLAKELDKIKDKSDMSEIECFNYGMKTAYEQVARDLEAWI